VFLILKRICIRKKHVETISQYHLSVVCVFCVACFTISNSIFFIFSSSYLYSSTMSLQVRYFLCIHVPHNSIFSHIFLSISRILPPRHTHFFSTTLLSVVGPDVNPHFSHTQSHHQSLKIPWLRRHFFMFFPPSLSLSLTVSVSVSLSLSVSVSLVGKI
jgi:hypothetical protein